MGNDSYGRTPIGHMRQTNERITALERRLVRGYTLPDRLSVTGLEVDDWNGTVENGFYFSRTGALNAPSVSDYILGLVVSRGAVVRQMAWRAYTDDYNQWFRVSLDSGATWSAWALEQTPWDSVSGKPATFPPSPHTHAAEDVVSGTFDTARIPDLDAAKTTSGVFDKARIPLGQYNILWTGGYYMDDSQTVNLSQAVSAQNVGIVLVWSGYASGSSQNYNWHHQLISKYQVVVGPGAGVIDTWLTGAGSSTFTTKYVYVNDTTITGNANNSTAPNNASVLRAVLGI